MTHATMSPAPTATRTATKASGKGSGLEDVLPLSPLQEGLLFHALADAEGDAHADGTDVYNTQLCLTLEGPLDPARLRTAAGALLRRHANLRAAFRQRANGQAIQVIHREVVLPWAEKDLSALTPAERDTALDALLDKDRVRRFDLTTAPALRFTLVRAGDELHHLVMTNHHILLDGWSAPIVQQELLTLYAENGAPTRLPAVTPYRAYLAWLAGREAAGSAHRDAAREAWTGALKGLRGPTFVAAPDAERAPLLPAYATARLDAERTAAVVAAARAHGLTVNTLLQGMWALVLGGLTGSDDVVFGSVVSGRPPEIPGIETMVGLFINTVPVRVRLDRSAPLAAQLARLQDEQGLLLDHQHLRLGELQRLVGRGDLFDTALTVENYPGGDTAPPSYAGVRVREVSGKDAAHYPLRMISGIEGDRLLLRLEYRTDVYGAEAARILVAHALRLLDAMTDRPGAPVAELPVLDAAERAALPAAPALPGPAPETEAPRRRRTGTTPQEEILCGLFGEVLGKTGITADDNFFECDGHSLSAVKLLGRVRAAFGVSVPVRELFEFPTPAALARRLRDGERTGPSLERAERPARVPLSFAQQRLWFMHRLEGPSPTYNIPIPLRLTGVLDLPALTAALGDLTARHETLRTVFPEADGTPYQRVLPAEPPAVELRETTAEGAARALLDAARHAFDLTTEAPLRCTVLRVSEREHLLLLLVHHIAGDGSSVAPLLRDLAQAYTARCGGAAPDWAPLPVQYADFALWQRAVLGDADDPGSPLARQLDFWRTALAGAPGQLELPTDRPRPAVADHLGASVAFRLDAEAHRGLAALARARQSTLFMTVQAGLAALLSAVGAGDDIPIGTAVAGRTDPALDDLAGFFVNTLVLRTDTSGDPAFAALLDRVREADLAAYGHQDLPFERLVEALNPARSSAHPLFQVMLAFQNTAEPEMDLPGLSVGFEGFGVGVARCDLSFSVAETHDAAGEPAGLTGIVEYATALFDPESAQALADRFVRLLTAVAADPALPLSRVDLLSAAERTAALDAGRGRPAPAAPSTLPALFAAQAAATPHAPAVRYGDLVLDYAELDARSTRLAHRLRALGAGPETVVALALPRSADLVAAVLAVSKAGAAYLPVDPDYPAQRVALMLEDTAPRCVVTTTAYAGRLPGDAGPLLLLDGPGPDAAPEDTAPPVTGLLPDHPAYVIYTSGSTGTPKGVVVTHRGLAPLAANHRALHGAGPGSRVLQFVSPSFDVSVAELTMALLTGGCLVIPEQVPVGAELAELLRAERITHAHLPPAVLAGLPETELPDLATLMSGGEAGTPRLVERWAPGRRMVNAYGPTEATVEVTQGLMDPAEPGRQPIGRPLPGVRVYVLDARLRPVPPGVPGEMYIAGDGVARGYRNRAALTASRFVADPFGAPGERMYRTGDLAARRRDGRIDFLGRGDGQVKLRGFRVELGEIQAALARLPEVEAAAVTVREDRPGDRRLVAYTVLHDATTDTGALRSALAGELPEHMVPSAVVALDALPLTPNGKLDVRALPAPPERHGAHRAPRSGREELMCRLFAEVLGVDTVGIDDNFFERGGHSLLASRLAGLVAQVLGAGIPMRAVFEAPTPAALLRRVDGADGADGGDGTGGGFDVLLPLRTTGEGTPLICVHPVGGLGWCYSGLLRTLDPSVPVYGLQSRGVDGETPTAASMDEMLDDYVAQIKAVRPQGPYHLLGWSLGGTLAQALAAELQQRGEEVGLLVLLDAYPVEEERRVAMDAWEILTAMYQAYARMHGEDDTLPADEAALRAGIVGYMGRSEGEVRHLDEKQRADVLNVLVNNVRLASPTEPVPYKGDVLLVAAEENVRDWARPQDWAPYLSGEFERVGVAATHEAMMAPEPAAEIGRILSGRL
ncbi:amino acid adenylation domain-containing protein [Streptomyces sp. NPDC059783]|uniref:amino acid adenylation domain-containing protein n=1 Tax=Streptomyces sp. NPDC059783 TaxID=3346944 RepID=UPI00364D3521